MFMNPTTVHIKLWYARSKRKPVHRNGFIKEVKCLHWTVQISNGTILLSLINIAINISRYFRYILHFITKLKTSHFVQLYHTQVVL